jgi:5-formyltetrahydrofolate cyclo-ligase
VWPRAKREFRKAFKAAITALDPEVRQADECALIARFTGSPGLAEAETVLLFVGALPDEVRTIELFSLAYEMRKTVFCPRVDRPGGRLSLHKVTDPAKDLVPGILGIPEPRLDLPEVPPAEVDWALIPGLGFDERGFRLGRGAGLYDRLIPLLRADAICWALCFDCQLVHRLPTEPHDQPLNGVSTPLRDVRGPRATQSF